MGIIIYCFMIWGVYSLYARFGRSALQRKKSEVKQTCAFLTSYLKWNEDCLAPSLIQEFTLLHQEGMNLLQKKEQVNIETLNQWLQRCHRKYQLHQPNTFGNSVKEFIETTVVIMAIVMGIRAVTLQLFKIPTGSMQPTLYGVYYQHDPELKIPGIVRQFFDYLHYGVRYVDILVKGEGVYIQRKEGGIKLGPISLWEATNVQIGDYWYSFPTDDLGFRRLFAYTATKLWKPGEILARGKIGLGDYLMVDRISYYFREPKRGEVVVFSTEGIRNTAPNGEVINYQFQGGYYIKRLVAIPGDTIRIREGKLYIRPSGSSEFVLLDDRIAPGTSKLYSHKGGYHGYTHSPATPWLKDDNDEYTLKPDEYFMLGDNSRNSADSRYWGPVPRRNIMGRAFFVWWPFSRRWGWVDSTPPEDIPTPPTENPWALPKGHAE